jgi:flagellar biosynthesis GTPase FlhF
MTEALQRAAKSFGEEAVILNSRETPSDLRSYGRFEVVATVSPADAPPQFASIPAGSSEPIAPRESQNGRMLAADEVHLLAGLNGTGKTTAALKMAIQQGVWKGRATAILHFDTKRMARLETIEWYCQAAGVLHWTPATFEKPPSHGPSRSVELLLIDTSGLPGDAPLPELLIDLLSGPRSHAHLVAPAWAGASYFEAVQHLLSRFKVQYLLPTFLDDSLLSQDAAAAAAKLDLGVRFLSSGPKVPNGFWESGEAQLASAAKQLASTKRIGPRIASPVASGSSDLSRGSGFEVSAPELVS